MLTTARTRFACLAARLHRAAALGLLALGVTFGAASPAPAQSADEAEKSSFVRFVEEQISTPDQKISLGRIDGALSSDVRIGSITIADRQGVWLEVTDVHLVWSRLALLQKRLEIDSLEAKAIRVIRRPAATGPEVAATPTFALPDLPVAVRIGKLAVPSVDLGEGIAGIPARFSVDGRASLAKDILDAQLAIQRLDGSGRLAFKLGYADQTRKLDLDLTLSEGAGGFLGTLLDIRGRPALDLSVRGSAPIDSFAADIALDADKARLVSGRAAIGRNAFGYRFALEANGSLERLVSERWGAYFAGPSSIALVAEAAESGWKISRASIASGAATFEGNGALAADGFPTALTVDARLGGRGARVPLPFTDGTVDGVRLAIDYGEAAAWKATIRTDGFESADAKLGSAALEASGVARNLADPAARSLSFTLSGTIAGLQAGDAAKAFRDPIRIAGRGNWRAGAATLVEGFSISDGNASIAFDGTLGLSAVTGAARIGVKDLAPFAALADRPLHGATALTATGRYEPIGGAFDLALDGMTTDLAAGLGRADALLGGRLALKGRVARATDGLHFDALRLGNGRIEASVAGLFGRWTSDLAINAAIADVGVATDRAKGRVALDARVTGASEKPTVAARIAGSNLVLQGRPFRNAALRFDGTVAQGEVDGIVALGGDLDGRPVTGQARLTSLADGGQAIEALIFRVGRSTISGDVTIDEAGLADGALAITSPDLGEVAPLVLMTAAGSVDAKISLSRANGRQDIKAKGTAKGVKIEAISIASADFDLSAQDLRGRPAITGTATARTIATPAATVAKIDARATPDPNGATRFDVTADGIAPTALRNAGIGALTARARGTLAERLLRFDAEATAGGGIRLTAGGAAAIDGASLDVAVKGNLPLAAANGFLRDRATRLAGTATLDLRVTGSAAEPRPAGTVTIGGFTLADPETGFRLANGQGRIRLGDGRATVESFSATTGRTGTIAASGTVGLPPADGFPADLTIRLARAHITNGDLLTADVSGAVTVRGPLAGAPTIGGTITVDRAEITIPERFSGRVTMLDVRQIAPPPKVARTLAKARAAIAPRSTAKSATGMVLALTIDAPARVFVRGRGLDTELGGRITLAGPIEAVRPVGAFQMIRGRLDVIGQRIDFTRGVVTLTGSLDPDIDFAAEAVRGSITITARVTGKASDPQIALTSSEDLPQDEILARFLFGQSITQLSPFQVVRLTVAVAQLAGGGQSADLVGKIRKSTGLDDLDIVTDSSGGTAVKVGRYLSDNIYFGVTTGGAGQTNATINLDITKNLKARGEAGTEGSSLGVFFEKEY